MGAPSLKPPGLPHGSNPINPLGRYGPPGLPGHGGGSHQPPIGSSGQTASPRTENDPSSGFQKPLQGSLQQAMQQRMVGPQQGPPQQAGFMGGRNGPNPFANGIPQMGPPPNGFANLGQQNGFNTSLGNMGFGNAQPPMGGMQLPSMGMQSMGGLPQMQTFGFPGAAPQDTYLNHPRGGSGRS